MAKVEGGSSRVASTANDEISEDLEAANCLRTLKQLDTALGSAASVNAIHGKTDDHLVLTPGGFLAQHARVLFSIKQILNLDI